MKNTGVGIILAAFTILPGPLRAGQAVPTPMTPGSPRALPISRSLSFRGVTLDLRDGTTVRGRLSGATVGSVRVRSSAEERDYALADIRRVVLDTEPQRSRGVLPGILLGLYAGNSALVIADGEPGFYARSVHVSPFSFWLIFGEGLFASVGGTLGWLAPFGRGPEVCEFPADPGTDPGAGARFARFLSGEPAPARVHLLIQSGFLVSGVTRRFEAFAAHNGFVRTNTETFPTKLSLLRGLELSFSMGPRWRTGLRLSFPAEPSFNYYLRIGGAVGTYTSLDQELRATAVHAIGAFELAGWESRSGLAASFGWGAGVASVRLTRNAWTQLPPPDPIPPYYDGYVTATAEVRKALPSAVVFGDLRYRLTPFVSIGLAADFTFMPALTVPALPDNGVPGGSQALSNGSVGLVLGYHF